MCISLAKGKKLATIIKDLQIKLKVNLKTCYRLKDIKEFVEEIIKIGFQQRETYSLA